MSMIGIDEDAHVHLLAKGLRELRINFFLEISTLIAKIYFLLPREL